MNPKDGDTIFIMLSDEELNYIDKCTRSPGDSRNHTLQSFSIKKNIEKCTFTAMKTKV